MIRFLIELFSVAVLATVVHAAVRTWGDPTHEAKRERARDRVMHGADDDDHTCHRCGAVAVVRELVMRADDALLCCAVCAHTIKYQERVS